MVPVAERMTRDEEHPLLGVAAKHVASLRAERAENRRLAAIENGTETIAAACHTATHVLGGEAANTLTWDVTPSAMAAFADVGGGLRLEYSPYPLSMASEGGRPGYLSLVRLCSECGYRWSKSVDSLEELAFLLEDLPKQTLPRGSSE